MALLLYYYFLFNSSTVIDCHAYALTLVLKVDVTVPVIAVDFWSDLELKLANLCHRAFKSYFLYGETTTSKTRQRRLAQAENVQLHVQVLCRCSLYLFLSAPQEAALSSVIKFKLL